MENEMTSVMINYKQHAASVSDPKVKNLVTMPEQTFQFVCAKRRMPPVLAEKGELGTGNTFDFRRQHGEFAFEADTAPVGYKSLTASSIVR